MGLTIPQIPTLYLHFLITATLEISLSTDKLLAQQVKNLLNVLSGDWLSARMLMKIPVLSEITELDDLQTFLQLQDSKISFLPFRPWVTNFFL